MYYLLKLDKSLPESIQAMLTVGAFEVIGQYDNLGLAQAALVDLLVAKTKAGFIGTHYEICSQDGAVHDWVGVYANRETLKGTPLAYMAPELPELTGEQLKGIRESLGLNQTEFGQFLGRSPLRTVQAWEWGERAIPRTISEILRLKGQL